MEKGREVSQDKKRKILFPKPFERKKGKEEKKMTKSIQKAEKEIEN